MSELPQRVERIIVERRLLKDGDALLVAVSGGVDSMVLLHVLHSLAAKHRWELAAAHFNHQLRGDEADEDERFVRRIAKKLGLPFESGRADIKQFARAEKVSVEMAARRLRHEFLAQRAHALGIATAALAHHADDQVELFFLRLLRGAGSRGLGGMGWTAPSPANARVRLIRPLLNETKSELVAFASKQKIIFREDATNRSADILRNRIRHRLLPLLRREFSPQINGAVLRSMELLRDEDEWITTEALRHLNDAKQARSFSRLPVALQRRVIQIGLLNAGIAPGFDLVEALRAEPPRWASAESNRPCRRTASGTLETRAVPTAEFSADEHKLLLKSGGRMVFGGVELSWRSARGTRVPHRHAGAEFFDADAIGGCIVLRHWRAGDRFQPIGMPCAVKLQDLFVNQKIAREQRRRLIIGTNESGEIFWVEGLRIGERFKVTPATKRILKWKWRREQAL